MHLACERRLSGLLRKCECLSLLLDRHSVKQGGTFQLRIRYWQIVPKAQVEEIAYLYPRCLLDDMHQNHQNFQYLANRNLIWPDLLLAFYRADVHLDPIAETAPEIG